MKQLVTDEWAKLSERIQAGEKIEFVPERRPFKLRKKPDKPVYVSEAQQRAVKR